jgi:hypothetical protein
MANFNIVDACGILSAQIWIQNSISGNNFRLGAMVPHGSANVVQLAASQIFIIMLIVFRSTLWYWD